MPDLHANMRSRLQVTLSFDPQQLHQILTALKALAPPPPPSLTPAQQQAVDKADSLVRDSDVAVRNFDTAPSSSDPSNKAQN